MKNNKLQIRLWPYMQYPDHREYLTQDKYLEFEGLYLNYSDREWMPQTFQYTKKAVSYTRDFKQVLKLIELL